MKLIYYDVLNVICEHMRDTNLFLGFTGIAWVACLYYAIFSGRADAPARSATA